MNTKPVSNNEIARFMAWLEAFHTILNKHWPEGDVPEHMMKGLMDKGRWNSKEGV